MRSEEALRHRLRALAELDVSEVAELCTDARLERFDAGDILFEAGAPQLWLGIVDSGEIDLVRPGALSARPSAERVTGGDLLGVGTLLDIERHGSTGVARGVTEVWTIPVATLNSLRRLLPATHRRLAGVALRCHTAWDGALPLPGSSLPGLSPAAATYADGV